MCEDSYTTKRGTKWPSNANGGWSKCGTRNRIHRQKQSSWHKKGKYCMMRGPIQRLFPLEVTRGNMLGNEPTRNCLADLNTTNQTFIGWYPSLLQAQNLTASNLLFLSPKVIWKYTLALILYHLEILLLFGCIHNDRLSKSRSGISFISYMDFHLRYWIKNVQREYENIFSYLPLLVSSPQDSDLMHYQWETAICCSQQSARILYSSSTTQFSWNFRSQYFISPII